MGLITDQESPKVNETQPVLSRKSSRWLEAHDRALQDQIARGLDGTCREGGKIRKQVIEELWLKLMFLFDRVQMA